MDFLLRRLKGARWSSWRPPQVANVAVGQSVNANTAVRAVTEACRHLLDSSRGAFLELQLACRYGPGFEVTPWRACSRSLNLFHRSHQITR